MNWKELLSAYLDGELAPEWRQKAERLLAESATARRYLEELRRVNSDLRRVPDHRPDESVHAAFRERAASELGVRLPETSVTGDVRTLAAGADAVPQTLVSVGAHDDDERVARRPERSDGSVRRIRWIGGAGVAAAAALLIALAMGLFNQPGDTPGPTPEPVANTHNGPDTPTDGDGEVVVDDDRGTPTPDAVEYPDEEVLAALDLLASDVDLEALAALEDTDLEILGDTDYLAMLESYDRTAEADSSDDERGN